MSHIKKVSLLRGCSDEFINQIEELGVTNDGLEERVSVLEPGSSLKKFLCFVISHPRKCTVYPSYPSVSKEHKKHGVVLWVSHKVDELIQLAYEKLKVSPTSGLLTEDEGQILETDMIENGQKLYLMSDVQ